MLVSERVIMMSLDQTFHHYLQHFPPVVGSIKFGFGEAIYLKQKVQRFQSRYCNGLLGSQIRKARSIIPAFLGPSSQKTWFQTKTQRARCYATLGSQVQSTPFKVLWLRSEPSSVAACLKQDPVSERKLLESRFCTIACILWVGNRSMYSTIKHVFSTLF